MVRENNINEIKKLIESKVDIKQSDQWGATTLFEARSPEMVELLVLKGGVNPNQQRIAGTNQDTALHVAVISSNIPVDVVSRLIQLGARTDLKDIHGMSPLDYAKKFTLEYEKVTSYKDKLNLMQKVNFNQGK
jgi:ankyrin repeat protein